MVSVVEACPLVEFPSHGPSCSPVAPVFEHHARGLGKVGGGEGRDAAAGMQAEEVVHMAVMVVGVVDVAAPFLELAITSCFVGRECQEVAVPCGDVGSIYAEGVGGEAGFVKDFADDGVGEGCAFIDRTVFRRGAGGSGQRAVVLLPKVVAAEVCAILDDGIRHIAQELQVACEGVVLPHMGGEPRCSHGIEIPRHVLVDERGCESEGVARDVRRPSAGIEILLGGCRAVLTLREDEFVERSLAFLQGAGECRPIVHLKVDVVVVVDMPRAVKTVGPDALKVGGEIAGT